MSDSWRLALQATLWRYGWIWPVTALLAILGIGISQFWRLALTEQSTQLKQETARLETQLDQQINTTTTTPALNLDDLALQALDQVTYSEAQISAILRAIYTLANKRGISVVQSEFQTINEGRVGLRQIQLSLPIRANYPQFKAFASEVLREHPGVSLDQLQIKREAITQTQPELRVKFSLWIDPKKSRVQTKITTRNKSQIKEEMK